MELEYISRSIIIIRRRRKFPTQRILQPCEIDVSRRKKRGTLLHKEQNHIPLKTKALVAVL